MITVYPVEDLEHLSDHMGRVLPDAYLVPLWHDREATGIHNPYRARPRLHLCG